MTTETSGAGATAPPLDWKPARNRLTQQSACGRFVVCETNGGGLYYAIDYADTSAACPTFSDPAKAREWCAKRPRGADTNGDEWPAEELPRW